MFHVKTASSAHYFCNEAQKYREITFTIPQQYSILKEDIMKSTLLTMAFALIAFIPQTFAPAHAMDDKMPKDAMVVEAPSATAVIFYSDSCGSCKILEPRMAVAMEAINMNKIDVVKFDFSNKATIEATKTLAAEKNVSSVLQTYGAKTGFVVLLDNTGKEVGKLKVDHTTSDIASELAKAIVG